MTSSKAWIIASLLAFLFVAAAHAHLVYVAVRSHPACVDHSENGGNGGHYRAAVQAC